MNRSGGRWQGLAICADDFGMSESIDAAILHLARMGRISGVGCVVQGQTWLAGARQLRNLDLDVGLHLNFTEPLGGWGPVYPLRELLFRAYAGLLDRAAVDASIELQLDHFESALGRRPDYVDGHQHVHQLPVIREALLAALRRRYGGPPWVRCTVRRGAGSVWRSRDERKAWVIEALGGRAFARAADNAGVARNERLLGVYGFEASAPGYERRMRNWLDAARGRDVLVCHPGAAAEPNDPIGLARVVEFNHLASDQFARALEERQLEVRRLLDPRIAPLPGGSEGHEPLEGCA